jgi:hypothetical protein
METKQLSSNTNFLSYFRDTYNMKIIDCTTSGGGRAEGLALLWNNCNFEIDIKMHDFNYIDFLINAHNKVWRATGIYGYPTNPNKYLTCKLINDLSLTNDNPNWLVFGDFNIIINSDEKIGGCPMDYNITSSLRITMDMCNLADLGFSGPKFTWHNRQQGSDYIQARLDRFLATPRWTECYPNYINLHLLRYGSDHCPIMLEFSPISIYRKNNGQNHNKKFEHMWLRNEEHFKIVKDSWKTHTNNITMKLSHTLSQLHSWGKQNFSSIPKNIQKVKDELQLLNSQHSSDPMRTIREKEKELDDLLQYEEMWWRQRSRAMWLQHGDKNTSYFHQKATQRQRRNKIEKICDTHGTIHYDPANIENTLVQHFQNIFDNQNTMHMQRTTEEEVTNAISSMKGLASPGPDGLPAIFYHTYWEIINKEVIHTVLQVLNNKEDPPPLMTLIYVSFQRKRTQPTLVTSDLSLYVM